MHDSAFLHTVTIETQTITYTNGRPSVETFTTSATGVKALISPMSARYVASRMGPTTDATHLLFLPPTVSIEQGDKVIDEETSREYRVVSDPLVYKNPVTKNDSHIQCELKPLKPSE